MNVKPGDIALVRPPRTGGFCECTGRLVEVVERFTTKQIYPDIPLGPITHIYVAAEDEWFCKFIGGGKVEVDLMNVSFKTAYTRMWGHRLKPFRDDPGADETLSWKDVPQEATA